MPSGAWGLLGGALVALIAASATWFAARRTATATERSASGEVGTSTAETLFEALRTELAAVRLDVVTWRTAAQTATETTFALREEMLALVATAAEVRAQLEECLKRHHEKP